MQRLRLLCLLMVILVSILNSAVSGMVIGCVRLCTPENIDCKAKCQTPDCTTKCNDENLACKRKCESAADAYTARYQVTNRTDLIMTAVPVQRIEEELEITGGDIFAVVSSGMQFITSRDGRVFRFLPNPKLTQSVLTEIYRIPESFNLDTMGNKGLYDIAFNRNFAENPLMYLLFARVLTSNEYDHENVIAEYKFNYRTMHVEFTGFVHTLPQKMNSRSGGFLKAGKSKYEADPAPLWVSSGGNPTSDPELSKLHPEYSSIYAVYPPEIKHANVLHKEQHGNAVLRWAVNLKNPIECDYAPLRESDQIYCLNEKYNSYGKHYFTAVQGCVFSPFHGTSNGEPGLDNSSTHTTTSTTTSEDRIVVEKIYAPVYQTFQGRQCLPDSLVYSFDNLLQTEYRRRVIVAFSPCKEENFRPPRLTILARSTLRKNWDLLEMPLDFGEELLTDIHLMGTERSRGLFFMATQVRTGYKDIYQVRRTDMYSSESGSVDFTSSTSDWSSTIRDKN